MASIKEMVSNGRTVRFTHYESGELWYVTETGFAFPVPIADAGDASFLAEDEALLFMRYITKHHDMLEQARADSQSAARLTRNIFEPVAPIGRAAAVQADECEFESHQVTNVARVAQMAEQPPRKRQVVRFEADRGLHALPMW